MRYGISFFERMIMAMSEVMRTDPVDGAEGVGAVPRITLIVA
jgi:hypothetical protein